MPASVCYEYRSMRLKAPSSCFGRRLREARLRVGMPQDKLGVAIGLDEGTASARLSRYETGTHAPPYEIAEKIARVLGVPVAFFYCDDDELSGVISGWARASAEQRARIRDLVAGVVGGDR